MKIPTLQIFKYGLDFPKSFNTTIYGDGDGAVNTISSEVCLKWAEQRPTFKCKTFPAVEHVHMVSNSTVLDAVNDAMNNNYM